MAKQQPQFEEFMSGMTDVFDYAFRRLVHTRPDDIRRPESRTPESGFAAPPGPEEEEVPEGETTAGLRPSLVEGDFETPEGVMPPEFSDLSSPVGEAEEARLLSTSVEGLSEAEANFGVQQQIEFQERMQNIGRHGSELMTRFFKQLSVDNHRDNQDLERVMELFLESRDTITDINV